MYECVKSTKLRKMLEEAPMLFFSFPFFVSILGDRILPLIVNIFRQF